jgi:ribose/xylose/arabinose/galactoside ABC-type transport system permease subunit
MKKELGTFLLLVVLCVVVAILNPQFLSGANLQNMARLVGLYGIFSIGLGLIIITGGIDLSVGSVFSLLGVLLSIALTEWHLPSILAVAVVIAIATALGASWCLITRLNLQPFIVTLCGLLFIMVWPGSSPMTRPRLATAGLKRCNVGNGITLRCPHPRDPDLISVTRITACSIRALSVRGRA